MEEEVEVEIQRRSSACSINPSCRRAEEEQIQRGSSACSHNPPLPCNTTPAPGPRPPPLTPQGNPWHPSYPPPRIPGVRGLHSSTSQLNLTACCGIGGACRG